MATRAFCAPLVFMLVIAACGQTGSGKRNDAASSPDDTAPGQDAPRDVIRDDRLGDVATADLALADDRPPQDSLTRDAIPDLFEPDLAAGPDGPARELPATDAARDPAGPDLPPELADLAPRDVPTEPSLRDVVQSDGETDSASRDALLDEGTRDLGLREASGDSSVLSIDGALAAFCSGDTPKAVVNGIASDPTVKGGMSAYDCCDGAYFRVTTPSFDYRISVLWQAQVGSGTSGYPATVDLANPPAGWGAWVELSCAGGTSCYPPPDSYNAGLEGVLQVSRTTAGFAMSLCLHLVEPAAGPHPILHSLDLYAPNVTTN